MISAPVYAELLAYPAMSSSHLDEMLRETDIAVDFDLNRAMWTLAGERFAQ